MDYRGATKEVVMDRIDYEGCEKLIDLGAVSIETRGGEPLALDQFGVGIPSGMSDAD
jgi:hypothetical protein